MYFLNFVFVYFVVFVECTHATTKRLSNTGPEQSYCADDSSETTLRKFWRNTQVKCDFSASKLVDLYEKASVKSYDKCGSLLRHHLAKALIDRAVTLYSEALIGQSFGRLANHDIRYLAERFTEYDRAESPRQFSKAVWRRVFDELDYFKDTTRYLDQIFESSIPMEAKAEALDIWSQRSDQDGTNMNLFIWVYLKLRKNSPDSNAPPRLQERYRSSPKEVKILYESGSKQFFGLRNIQHSEFLYAPRDNGPTPDLRTPLTWSKEKNSTDSDGHLLIELSATNSSVAVGSLYGPLVKFLYADSPTNGVYFWIGSETKANRWWSPKWLADGSFSFRNDRTGQLLCATRPYDENRRYVTLQPDADDASCHWSLVPF